MAFASDLEKQKVRQWWEYDGTFSTVLTALAIDEFGTDCFSWEPETIRLQARDVLGVDIPQVNMDKLMAMITALSTNLFYTAAESFSHIANALNDAQVNFQVFDPVDADEAAWAITEILLSDPPESDEPIEDRFSPEIRRYLGVILDEEGIITPPDVLQIAVTSPRAQTGDETFADDPIIYAGFYKISQQKSQAVVAYVRNRLSGLIGQLQTVPLQNRDQKTWQRFLDRARARLRSTKRSGD